MLKRDLIVKIQVGVEGQSIIEKNMKKIHFNLHNSASTQIAHIFPRSTILNKYVCKFWSKPATIVPRYLSVVSI